MKINKKYLKNIKGFTLVELIVVIAILAVLAVIAVPRLIGYQDRASETTDRNNATVIAHAINLALTEGRLQLSGAENAYTGFTGYDNPADASDLADVLIPNYLESIPRPQSVDAGDFAVNVNSNGTITITAGGETFYPTTDAGA